MPVAAGTRLGLYEVFAPIGAGGMGGQTQFRLVTEFCGKEISVLRPPRCN